MELNSLHPNLLVRGHPITKLTNNYLFNQFDARRLIGFLSAVMYIQPAEWSDIGGLFPKAGGTEACMTLTELPASCDDLNEET